jgi:hypothetical protein
MSGIISNFKATSLGKFWLGLTGVLLKNSSGNLVVRNNADSADAEITTSKLNVSGNSLVINSDAANSGSDRSVTIQRSGSQTESYTITLPPDNGSPGQYPVTDGNGVLSWVTPASGAQYLTVDVTPLTFGSGNTVAMFTKPAGARLQKIDVVIDTPFNGTNPTMSVGISGSTSKYFPALDLTGGINFEAGDTFQNYSNTVAVGSEDLIITYVSGSSTAGDASVLVYYSVPS